LEIFKRCVQGNLEIWFGKVVGKSVVGCGEEMLEIVDIEMIEC